MNLNALFDTKGESTSKDSQEPPLMRTFFRSFKDMAILQRYTRTYGCIQIHRAIVYGSHARLLTAAEKALAPEGR
jgi:hypothetical protein